MKTLRVLLSRSLWLPAALLLLCLGAAARAGSTFNVMNYGAAGNGTTDDTVAIQNTINAAIAAGSGNTVLLPAGTYLIAGGPRQPGAEYRRLQRPHVQGRRDRQHDALVHPRRPGHCFFAYGNTNLTIQNFSSDVQAAVGGLYDMSETQGTITAISRTPGSSTVSLTVQVEQGYPSLSRADIQNATANGYGRALWLKTDPTRLDFGDAPSLTGVTPTGSGTTGTLAVNTGNNDLYMGEKMDNLQHSTAASGATLATATPARRRCRTSTTTAGPSAGWATPEGAATSTSTTSTAARRPTSPTACSPAWRAGGPSAGASPSHVTNSQFLQTWDNVFDMHVDQPTVLSQPAANQVLVSGTGDYQAGRPGGVHRRHRPPMGRPTATAPPSRSPDQPERQHADHPEPERHRPRPRQGLLHGPVGRGPSRPPTTPSTTPPGATSYFFGGIRRHAGLHIQGQHAAGARRLGRQRGAQRVHNVTVTGSTFLHAAGLLIQATAGRTPRVRHQRHRHRQPLP